MTTDNQQLIDTLELKAAALTADLDSKVKAKLSHAACDRELARVQQSLSYARRFALQPKQG